jgi:hypothetical protein
MKLTPEQQARLDLIDPDADNKRREAKLALLLRRARDRKRK